MKKIPLSGAEVIGLLIVITIGIGISFHMKVYPELTIFNTGDCVQNEDNNYLVLKKEETSYIALRYKKEGFISLARLGLEEGEKTLCEADMASWKVSNETLERIKFHKLLRHYKLAMEEV